MDQPSIRQLRRAAESRLIEAGVDTPTLDARLLIQHALGLERHDLLFMADVKLEAEQSAHAWDLVERRAARVPVSRIIGRRGFWTLDLRLNGATLDPRPDTETVVDAVLEVVTDREAPLRVLDLGTGSGAILLALLSELPNATGVGVDLAEEALVQAADNAAAHELDGRATFRKGDWTEGLEEAFDVVVSNPPYIPSADIDGLDPEVREHDPRLALDGGADGLDAYRAIAEALDRALKPGGIAALEVGIGQAEAVERLFVDEGFVMSGTRNDLAGIARCVRVEKKALDDSGT